VEAASFLHNIETPTRAQLQALFEQHRRDRFDPASPTPGFEAPARVKVAWVTADPRSEYCQRLAAAVAALETTPPVSWLPTPPAVYQAAACLGTRGRLDKAIAREAKQRLPVGTTLLLAAADPTPLSLLGQLQLLEHEPRFLPFAVVEHQLRERLQRQLAAEWTRETMYAVKEALAQHR